MKRTLLTILITSIFSHLVNGQNEKNEKDSQKLNSFSVEFYQPIDAAIRDYNYVHNGLQFADWEYINYQSRSSANAIGLCYERAIKNNWIIRTRVGMSFTEIQESNKTGEVPVSQDVTESQSNEYQYKDKSINIFAGLGKRVHLSESFNLVFGIDFSSIYNLGGESEHTENWSYSNQSFYRKVTNTFLVGDSNIFAFGPYIKPELILFDNFFIAAEVQMFYSRVLSSDTSYNNQITELLNFESPDIVVSEIDRVIDYDIKQWNWSSISPLLRIGYKF